VGRFFLTKPTVVAPGYENYTIEGKQLLKVTIHPLRDFKFKTIFEDDYFKGLELELLQIKTGEKDEDSIEMF
jgi:hypothetical protein